MGTKRSLLVDGRGIPLSLVVSGANRHDVKLLGPTLVARVVRHPRTVVQHLCADKGYAGKPAERAMKKCRYIPHVRQRGEETRTTTENRRYPARRWVVERTHSWLNRFRKLAVRFEKLAESYEALLEIACALLVLRQCFSIHG
jgi:putative transposase